uniref:Profilin-4 n=1 Tax=Sphenodon punctatus TaxID=8508 RepID=A0A8D0HBV1_SPHPU
MSKAQNLLKECLIITKHVEHAALIKLKDGSVLFSNKVLPCMVTQQAHLFIHAFYKNLLQVRREGLYFKDKHFTCVRADDNSIYAKWVNQGLVAAKTDTYILLATYSQGMYPSVCVEAVEKLGNQAPHFHVCFPSYSWR